MLEYGLPVLCIPTLILAAVQKALTAFTGSLDQPATEIWTSYSPTPATASALLLLLHALPFGSTSCR